MDIHKLRCVISLAQLKNVTRAAQQNYITQSTMSSTISAIEAELGVRLFIRSNRQVSLTPAGEKFAEAAEEIVRKYDAAVAQAQLSASGNVDRVVIGFNSLSVVAKDAAAITKALRKKHPDLSIRLCRHSVTQLSQYLLDGRVDIIFTNHFEARKYPEARTIAFAYTHPCVFVPKGHRLTEKDVVTIKDIENETLFCASTNELPNEISAAAEMLRQAGIPFTSESPVANEDAIISMVEAGLGLYPATNWYKQALEDRVDCVPLELDAEGLYVVVMWTNDYFEGIAEDIARISRAIYSKHQDEMLWTIC